MHHGLLNHMYCVITSLFKLQIKQNAAGECVL